MGLSKVSGSGIDTNVITPANLHSTFVLPHSKLATGPGSGLDADTIDGYESTNYLGKNGSTYYQANNWIDFGTSSGKGLYWGGGDASGWHIYPLDASNMRFRTSGNTCAIRFDTNGGTARGFVYANNSAEIGFLDNSGGWRLRVPSSGSILRDSATTMWDSANDGAGSGLDADLLDGANSAVAATADTIVKRTSVGDVQTRLVRSNYSDQAAISGALAYRVEDGTNNYIRFCNDKGNIRSFLNVLRSDASDTLSGNLTVNRLFLGGSSNGGFDYNSTADTLEILTTNGSTHSEFTASAFVPASSGTKNLGANALRWATVHANSVKIDGSTAWHAGNDGAGSGLDSDLLDGQQGSYYLDYNNLTNVPAGGGSDADTLDGLDSGDFLRSNANDTYTGVLSISGSINNSSTGGSSGAILGNLEIGYGAAYNSISAQSNAGLYLNYTSSGGVYVYNNNNIVWHAGNDGAGSGLDADTIDGYNSSNYLGKNGSSYYQANNWIDLGTSGTTGLYWGSGAANGWHIYPANATKMRFRTSGTTTELRLETDSGTTRGSVYVNNSNEIGFLNNSGSWQLRVPASGSLMRSSSYYTIWDSGNDGSGSGLDADTVHGSSPSSLLVGKATTLDPGTSYQTSMSTTASSRAHGMEIDFVQSAQGWPSYGTVITAKSYSGGGGTLQLYNGYGSGYGGNNLRYRTADYSANSGNPPWTSFRQIWDSGNDGSGSGLDADTCDGQHLGTSANVEHNNIYAKEWFRNNDAGDGLYNQNTSKHFYSAGTNYWHIDSGAGLVFYDQYNSSQGGSTGRKGYVYFDSSGFGLLSNDGSWAYRHDNTYADIYGSIRRDGSYTLWDSGNDGSGSGLDADTTDGLHVHSGTNSEANKIVRTNGSGYIMAGWINTSSGNNTSTTPDRFYGSHDGYIRYYDRAYTQMFLGNTYKYTTSRRQHTTDSNYWVGTMGWGTVDFNTLFHYGSGHFDTWSNPGNQPSGTSHWLGHQSLHYSNGSSSAYGHQFTVGAGNPALCYLRGRWGSSFTGWAKMWNANNDGSGSGLDADTVDGIQASSFLEKSTSSTTISTPCKFTAGSGAGGSGSSSGFQIESNSQYMLAMKHTSSGVGPRITMWEGGSSSYKADIGWSGSGYIYLINSEQSRTLRIGSTLNYLVGSTNYTVWHSGNDGSGSGLDADTVKGGNAHIQGTSIYGYLNGTYTPGYGNSTEGNVIRSSSVSYFSKSSGVAVNINRNNNGDCVSIRYGGNEKGSIEVRSTRTYFRTTSDYRLKTNVLPIANAVDKIKALKPSQYNWIDTGETDYGFLAHEIQPLIPGASSGVKDEVDENGDPVYQKVDQATVIPFLTAALKEALVRIEVLEEKLAALEN